jgi:hypothetical protein
MRGDLTSGSDFAGVCCKFIKNFPRGMVFRRLTEQAIITGPLTEADVPFGYN